MRRAYRLLDVFTETRLAGNPLAVVLDADGLDDARMQAIAREFNLSETVFVFPPRNPVNAAALRIFTPGRELPFAGHPTVGAAALIAQLRAPQMLAVQDLRLVLEERVGDVVCVARHRRGQALAASFALPRLPQQGGPAPSAEEIAARLGLAAGDVGFGAHRPVVFGAGVDYVFAPLASVNALARADPDLGRWGADDGPAIFCYTPASDGADYRAACTPPAGASAKIRRPVRPPPPSPASSCASLRLATAITLWSSTRASRWVARAALRSAWRSSAAR